MEGYAAVSVSSLFTPAATEVAELEAMTVGRPDLRETLTARIRSSAQDGSRPHTLLVAPRGAGKTHTLRLALHRALSDALTARSVLPAVIAEDSLAIGSYADLLVELARAIGTKTADAAKTLRGQQDPVGIEAVIIDAADGRMILPIIENLDRVFEAIGAKGQGSLRAWVETSAAITLFGTAPVLFPGVSSRDYPWYGSFMIETLPELGIDDAAALLQGAARRRAKEDLATFAASDEGRVRVAAVHEIIGGRPRLWHLLAEVTDIAGLDAVSPAVDALLDRLAPHYQQLLWQLPAGEQRLVVELARGPGARSVSDLAEAVGVSNQSASAALGRLAAERWVTSSKADGDRRTSWYDLTDPLLRRFLHYRSS